jgi:hypothetical protein
MPAFDSKYVSLMVTGYDHYVNIPLSTRQGNFKKPETMLFFTERTEGYEKGERVEGVDQYFEATGDFLSAVFRVMPHANEPERFERIKQQMQSVKLRTLSELRGEDPKPIDDIEFPAVGKTDVDVYENNLLDVMQFVFNHTTFDPDNELDQKLLATYKPLGVEPGKITYEMRTQPGYAAPAELRFWINDKEAVTGKLQRTIPGTFTASETFDVGMDLCSPVANDYFDKAPFKFEGTLKRLHFKYLNQQ